MKKAKTGGRTKTKGRIELETMPIDNLMELFKKNRVKDIAEMFKVDTRAAGDVITSRLFSKEKMLEAKIKSKLEEKTGSTTLYNINEDDLVVPNGAWRNSAEGNYFYNNQTAIMRKINSERV